MNNNYPTFLPIIENSTIYLTFLQFDSEDLLDAANDVRDACRNSKNLSKEIAALFLENGWREHLLAGAAILTQDS